MDWRETEIVDRDGATLRIRVASYVVPQNWSEPDSGSFELELLRIGHQQRCLLFLTGGPGEDPADWIRTPILRGQLSPLLARYSLVFLRQRGSSGSTTATPMMATHPEDFLVSPQSASVSLMSFLDQTGLEPRYFTPEQSAKDVRRAVDLLETELVGLLGYSYGTHLLMQTSRLELPQGLKLGLCGFEGLDQTLKLPSQIQTQLEKLDRHSPGLMEDIQRASQLLDRKTLQLDSGRELGLFGFQWMISSWVGLGPLTSKIRPFAKAVQRRDLQLISRAVEGFVGMLNRRVAAFYWKDSWSNASPQRKARIKAEEPGCILGGACNFPFLHSAFDAKSGIQGFANASWNNPLPTMILTGSLDGFTPTSNLQEGLQTSDECYRLEIENATHSDLLRCLSATEQLARHFSGEDFESQAHSLALPKLD